MASDVEWIEDVRRWCGLPRARHTEPADPPDSGESQAASTLGYEAAQPALQARYWPDAPTHDGTDVER